MIPQHVLLHLSLLENVGPVTILRIIQKIRAEDLGIIYEYTQYDFMHQCGISALVAQHIVEQLVIKKKLEEELTYIARNNVTLITWFDELYPELLREIYAPPMVLYIQGSMNFNQKALSLVGSRKATEYGKRVVAQLVPDLVAYNWTIVSGGALGIDSYAHEQTLHNRGITVAVLGSGLLKPYPLSNKKLFDNIIDQGGTLVSPFPLTMQAMAGNFPARNRIIAGLSKGCVVIQAAEKSGALITARFALEQSREVFAVPGPIDDMLSAGCHSLLRQGATLVAHADDIFTQFGETVVIADAKKSVSFSDKQLEIIPSDIASNDKGLNFYCKEPTSLDELMEKTGFSMVQLQEQLFDLQLEGKIKQDFSGLWISV